MVNPQQPSPKNSWFKFFQYQEGQVSPSDARTVLLVVATLIATVTFQAAVNPPGGVWQDTNDRHMAGRSIYASDRGRAYVIFLLSNTFAFSTSIVVILVSTYRFPLYEGIFAATGSMMVTYVSSLFAITPHVEETISARCAGVIVALVPFVGRLILQRYRNDG